MQILVPISGYSAFFPKEDYFFPKPLIDIAGTPMIEVVIRQLQHQFPAASFTFVVDPEHVRSFYLDRTLQLIAGDHTQIIERPGPTSGALSSCLLSIDSLNLDLPLIIANSDQIIEDDLSVAVDTFANAECASAVITFDSIHPRWSYVLADNRRHVLQTFEKKVASRSAVAGFYYYRSARLFFEAAKKVLLHDAHVDGNFYISSTINQIILDGGLVLHYPIASQSYHSFYAPSKLEEFERSSFALRLREGFASSRNVNVVIPAAGEGSRFKNAGWKSPKPYIDVDGIPMLERVISNVKPAQASVTLLLRDEHIESNPSFIHKLQVQGCRVFPVETLTEGTASTVLLARQVFDNDQPLMIANSDQLVDFDVDSFIDDCLRRDLDGSILVFRDPSMNPKWSFVKVDKSGIVTEVAEKMPISDLATVGIYLFTKGRDFLSASLDMILANDRVNNEFYTCPVYNYFIKRGGRIGTYEVPASSMSGLGTPDDLAQYLKFRGLGPSLDSPDSPRCA